MLPKQPHSARQLTSPGRSEAGAEAKTLGVARAGTRRCGAESAATTRGAAVAGVGAVGALLEAVLPLEEHTPPRGARKTVDMMNGARRSRGKNERRRRASAPRGGWGSASNASSSFQLAKTKKNKSERRRRLSLKSGDFFSFSRWNSRQNSTYSLPRALTHKTASFLRYLGQGGSSRAFSLHFHIALTQRNRRERRTKEQRTVASCSNQSVSPISLSNAAPSSTRSRPGFLAREAKSVQSLDISRLRFRTRALRVETPGR